MLHADKITYEQLSDKAKDDLLSKTVTFQGKESTVRELIGASQPEDVFDLGSIEELLLMHDQEKKLAIPSYSNLQFQKSFYIKRKMQFGFDDDLIQEEKLERQVVIIKGVAGTGKSTVLSHFYDEIKNKDPNIWVIRMDLKEHFEDFARYDGK